MTTVSEQAGRFLTEVADRLNMPGDRAPIKETLARACGGQLDAYAPDGRRASTLTPSGTPFEVSVAGGKGAVSPAIRFVTETATQTVGFADRLDTQLRAVRDLVDWLPHGGPTTAEALTSFVSTLYPEGAAVPKKFRSPTWLGVVHRGVAVGNIARLTIYGGLRTVPGAVARLRDSWPEFAGLGSVADSEDLFVPVGAALEVDARGDLSPKIYLKTRYRDVAVPMRLVRCFGDPAWEVISEFVRAGLDAATLYRYQFFVCCSRGPSGSELGISLMPRRREDLTDPAKALAARHHGSLAGIQALTGAAEATGANWRFSGIGLGFSEVHGVGKLNIYGLPTWVSGNLDGRGRVGQRKRVRQADASSMPSVDCRIDTGQAGTEALSDRNSDIHAAIDAACRFLVERQDSDGHWRDYSLRPGRSESWITGCVGFALGSVGSLIQRPDDEHTEAIRRAVTVLRDSCRPGGWGYNRKTACDADSTSWVVRLLAMCDPHTRIPAQLLTRYLTPSGGVRTFSEPRTYGTWATEHDEVTPVAGLALCALGVDGVVATLRSHVVGRHRMHRRWKPFWWNSGAYVTAQNLIFLARTGGIPEDIEEMEREKATEFFDLLGSKDRTTLSSLDIVHHLSSAVQVGACESVEYLGRELLATQLSDGGWPSSYGLQLPSRRDSSVKVFADDRRLLTTAMSVSALLDLLTIGDAASLDRFHAGDRTAGECDYGPVLSFPNSGNEEQ